MKTDPVIGLCSGEALHLGVVSKKDHFKNHARILREEGHKILLLEESPVEIPDGVEALILRITSCSHAGSNTAQEWSRKTGKPLIVESGLSGIKRRIEEIKMQKFISVKAQKSTFPPIPQGSLTWETEVPYRRLKKNWDAIQTPEMQKFALRNEKALVDGLLAQPDPTFPPLPDVEVEDLNGKPLRFFMLVLGLLNPQQRALLSRSDMRRFYASLSGKSTTRAVIDACAWVFGLSLPSYSKGQMPLPEPEPQPTVDVGATTKMWAERLPKPLPTEATSLVAPALEETPSVTVEPPVPSDPANDRPVLDTGAFDRLRTTVEDFVLMASNASEETARKFAALEQKMDLILQGQQAQATQFETLLALQEANRKTLQNIMDVQLGTARALAYLQERQEATASDVLTLKVAAPTTAPAAPVVQGDLLGSLQVLQSLGAQVSITLGNKA